MVQRMSMEAWEEAFEKICEEKLEEDPLYDYIHLYKKGLSPEKAFIAYLKENPDYQEKMQELMEEKNEQEATKSDPAEQARIEAQEKLRREALERLSRYCPECARDMTGKKVCKCGYKKKKTAAL
ncbi:MAG TPA: hypothetical protein PLP29_13155 [Candidatus Ozemobacteraceae bacterium]|mgnify:CR=1 FL=1|nr:hypothetical protein [Candidatus Ozemobacteraceae bacterium]